jgi:hypothetical protein
MKTTNNLALSCSLLALVALAPACSSDGSLGDNRRPSSSDQNVTEGGSATAGAAGKSGASGGSSGAASSCAEAQCVRAIECVAACDGPVLQSGCCPCDAGTFDRMLECSGSNGGTSGGGTSNGSGSTGASDAGGANGQAGADTTAPVTGLNAACVTDTCPENLTPVHFYGVAGMAGPEFCWCTIPCADDPKVCPAGTACTTLSDGPGTVCFAP